VILVGGAEQTEQAGLAIAASKKPLAGIGSFGGVEDAAHQDGGRTLDVHQPCPNVVGKLDTSKVGRSMMEACSPEWVSPR
jgi:hypothetical protein